MSGSDGGMTMTKMKSRFAVIVSISFLTFGLALFATRLRIEAAPRSPSSGAQAEAGNVSVGADDIGGVVTSSNGPEAGVWVIAETADFKVKFRKIVVTDDKGRYLLPELPKAAFKIWVRGYGLVDSP